MKQYAKINKSILLLTLATCIAALSGCVSFPTVAKGEVPQNYQFDTSKSEGIVAVSVSCNIAEGDGKMHFFQDATYSGEGKQTKISSRTDQNIYTINFHCNSSDANASQPELKLLNLPYGEYMIYDWNIQEDNGNLKSSRSIRPLYFPSFPNKVIYIGRIILEAGYSNKWGERIENKSAEDMPVLRKRLPLIPASDIRVVEPIFAAKDLHYSN